MWFKENKLSTYMILCHEILNTVYKFTRIVIHTWWRHHMAEARHKQTWKGGLRGVLTNYKSVAFTRLYYTYISSAQLMQQDAQYNIAASILITHLGRLCFIIVRLWAIIDNDTTTWYFSQTTHMEHDSPQFETCKWTRCAGYKCIIRGIRTLTKSLHPWK
jgi:hypothetical protein